MSRAGNVLAATDVHAAGAGTVLAWHRTYRGRYSQAVKGSRIESGEVLESCLLASDCPWLATHMVDYECFGGVGDRPAADRPDRHLEP